MSKKAEGFSLRFVLINTGNISRKVLSKVLRSFVKNFERLHKFFTNNSVFPGSMSQGVDAMRAQFVEGTFGIWGNASQEAGVFTSQFPIDKFEWGVAEVPSLDGTRKGA